MEPVFLRESSRPVRLMGRLVRKYEVPLGRQFEEEGRNKQAYTDVCLYSSFESGTFRFGDQWFYKHPQDGILALKPNAPFGYPQRSPNFATLSDGTKVHVLKVADRGPV